jgi:hypothetical protein
LKPLFNNRDNFLDGGFSANINHPTQYTVVVIYLDGYRKEYKCIERPFQYMAKIKSNPKVKTCFIK